MDKVFEPNLTTELIISGAKNFLQKNKISSYLELGCGCGQITLSNFEYIKKSKIVITDVSDLAINTAKDNFKKIKYNIDARVSNIYESIDKNEKFDLIISDVASISEIFLSQTNWYDGVSCKTGVDGLNLISKVLNGAKNYIHSNGSIIYPVLSLSSENGLKKIISNNFKKTIVLKEKEWPFKFHDQNFINKLDEYRDKGYINFKNLSGLHVFKTSVYQSFI